MVSTVGSQVVYAGLKSGLGASASTRAYAVTIAGCDLGQMVYLGAPFVITFLFGAAFGLALGRALEKKKMPQASCGEKESPAAQSHEGLSCTQAGAAVASGRDGASDMSDASSYAVGAAGGARGRLIDSCVPHVGGAASCFEVPTAQEQQENYEYVAERYVKKQNNKKRRATIAQGVAAVLANRLGLENPMEGLPVIQRADGSVGDVGESWWDEAAEVKVNRNPEPGFSQYLNMDPDWTAAHPINYTDQGGEGATLASLYAQVKPEVTNYNFSNIPDPAKPSAAVEVQPVFRSIHAMDLNDVGREDRVAAMSAEERVRAIRSSVPTVVGDAQPSGFATVDAKPDVCLSAPWLQAHDVDVPLSARIPQVKVSAARQQENPLWEGENQLTDPVVVPTETSVAARETVEYSSLEGKSREEIWQMALDALDEKVETTGEQEGDFFSSDPVVDLDIDDPDGMEQKTAFIPFRVPAGRPEVKDTESYIDYLLSDEFSHVDSQAVRRNAREYLRVVQGGKSAAYVPDHLGTEKSVDKDQREA